MYTTLEADIKNGRIKSAEAKKIPAEAHVLITILTEKHASLSESGASGTLRGTLKQYANANLVEQENMAWGRAAEHKNEAN